MDNNAGLSDLFEQGFDGALPLPAAVTATTSRDTGGVDVTGVGSMCR